MGERSVTVFRTKDPVEGEIVVDLLRQEGLEARLIGTRNAALIGVAANVFDLKIEVPDDESDEAGEIIDAYLKGERAPEGAETAEPPTPADGAPEPPEDAAADPPPRRALLAAGASLVFPGGGHFYARRTITGLLLVLGYVGALAALMDVHYVESTCGTVIFVGLVLADLVGGQRAVRAYNRGARPGALSELGAGALLLALVYSLGIFVGTNLPPPKEKRSYYSDPS